MTKKILGIAVLALTMTMVSVPANAQFGKLKGALKSAVDKKVGKATGDATVNNQPVAAPGASISSSSSSAASEVKDNGLTCSQIELTDDEQKELDAAMAEAKANYQKSLKTKNAKYWAAQDKKSNVVEWANDNPRISQATRDFVEKQAKNIFGEQFLELHFGGGSFLPYRPYGKKEVESRRVSVNVIIRASNGKCYQQQLVYFQKCIDEANNQYSRVGVLRHQNSSCEDLPLRDYPGNK